MMKRKTIISASLLSCDFMRAGEETQAVIQAGSDWIHVDVMDGVFVPNITVGIPFVEKLKKVSTVPLDVHLMIVRPELHVSDFSAAGADNLTVHVENNPNTFLTLQQIHAAGLKASIALNPSTPAEMAEPLLPFVDMVLVMTVNPGFGGQKFIPETLEKIRKIKNWLDEKKLNADIEVDGGINRETAALCAAAGANVFVAGSAIFGFPQGYAAGIRAIRSGADEA